MKDNILLLFFLRDVELIYKLKLKSELRIVLKGGYYYEKEFT